MPIFPIYNSDPQFSFSFKVELQMQSRFETAKVGLQRFVGSTEQKWDWGGNVTRRVACVTGVIGEAEGSPLFFLASLAPHPLPRLRRPRRLRAGGWAGNSNNKNRTGANHLPEKTEKNKRRNTIRKALTSLRMYLAE